MKRTTIALMLTSLAAFGCSRNESPEQVTASDVRKEATEAVDTAARYAAQEKDAFVKASQQQLNRLKDQLAALDSDARTAQGEAKAKLEAQQTLLAGQLRAVEARLADLRAAGAAQWRDARAQFTAEMRALEQSFERSGGQRRQG
jgi:predicted  nucleic acid-binding Zn-ribbon protein